MEAFDLHWGVVERPHFLEEGRRAFADGVLTFYGSVAEALAVYRPDLVLVSSVLQYAEDTCSLLLEEVVAARPRFVMLDRAPMMVEKPDRITVQTVSQEPAQGELPLSLAQPGTPV